MALKIQQTVTLTGTSEIDGVQIAYFNASIPQGEGSSSVSRNIINQALYDVLVPFYRGAVVFLSKLSSDIKYFRFSSPFIEERLYLNVIKK